MIIDDTRRTLSKLWNAFRLFLGYSGSQNLVRLLKRNHERTETKKDQKADIMQRGGDVLIDPNGIVRMHHVGKGPADRPGVEMILKIVAEYPF